MAPPERTCRPTYLWAILRSMRRILRQSYSTRLRKEYRPGSSGVGRSPGPQEFMGAERVGHYCDGVLRAIIARTDGAYLWHEARTL